MEYQIKYPNLELDKLNLLTNYLDEKNIKYTIKGYEDGGEISFSTEDKTVMGYVDTFIDFGLFELI